MKRILIIGTHPMQTNGYARMIDIIIRELSKDNKVIVYGFNANPEKQLNHTYNRNVIINPVSDFGVEQIGPFIELCNPDKVFIYNDPYVVCGFLTQMKSIDKTFETIVYLDLVYKVVKHKFVNIINDEADKVVTFLEHWKVEAKRCGIQIPIDVLPHVKHESVYKIDKIEARQRLNIEHNGPVMLNINKNTPRKRYDILMMSLDLFHSQNPDSELTTLIATSHADGAFILDEMLEYYPNLKSRVSFVADPHGMSNDIVNLLYNACDIGINVCDGEGFGLCNYEHACVGAPQVLSEIDTFKEIFGESAKYAKVSSKYYSDYTRDSIGGMAELISPESVAERIKETLEEYQQLEDSYKEKYSKEEFNSKLKEIVGV